MGILKKLFILLCLVGFYSPAYASFSITDFGTCMVSNEAEKGDEKKEGEDEEPDCE